MRKIPAGTLQPEDNLSSIPEGKQKLLFKSLPDFLLIDRDFFATKCKRGFYFERGNQGREISRFKAFGVRAWDKQEPYTKG
jgi:hypothetical protein